MFGALVFIKLIHPIVTKVIAKILTKIPDKSQSIITNTLIGIVAIDTIASSLVYLQLF